MSNPDTPSVEELQAEIDRLNAQIADKNSGTQTPAEAVNATPDHGIGVIRVPSEGAKIIGAATDLRGGTVLGYSDGTVGLVNVPQGTDGKPAEPYGSAPDGTYVAFYVDDDGQRYNWVAEDGKTVESITAPVINRA